MCSKLILSKNISINFFKLFKVFYSCYRSKNVSPRFFRTFFSTSDGVVENGFVWAKDKVPDSSDGQQL